MPIHKPFIVSILFSFFVASCNDKPPTPKTDFTTVVEGLQIQTYGDVTALDSPVLLIFLHGDDCVADYMKTVANTVVRKNSLSFVMARPGCAIGNRRSLGDHGKYDHYTEGRIDAVADSIRSLKIHYKARKVFLIGHSGGAVTSGIIAGKHPNLIDGFVAIAFPANIPEWRVHRNKGKAWENSLSPHEYVDNIGQSTLIYIVNGSEDENTPPSLSVEYSDTATKRGLRVEHVVLEGENHKSSFFAQKVWSIISDLTYK